MNWNDHFKRVSKRAKYPASFGGDGESTFGGGDPNVLAVQHILNVKGANPKLKEDGIWGPATRAALIVFQRQAGIPQSGVIDPVSLVKLGIALQKLPPIPRANLAPIPGIKQVVVDSFPAFSTKFEGHTNKMYKDTKNFVTTGVGDLIDPIRLALALPWKHESDGSLANAQEVTDAWNIIKHGPGGPYKEQAPLTNLYLTDADVAKLVSDKMRDNHATLSSEYPNYHMWPADAQLALHSIAWAWGPAFARVWGNLGTAFKQAVNVATPDFSKAAGVMIQASTKEEAANSGLVPRDVANVKLFSNADAVTTGGGDPDSLFYPNALLTGAIAFAKKHAPVGGVIAVIVLAIGVLALAGRNS